MTGVTITARLDDAEVRRAFAQWKRLGADATPLMRAIGVKLVANT